MTLLAMNGTPIAVKAVPQPSMPTHGRVINKRREKSPKGGTQFDQLLGPLPPGFSEEAAGAI